MQDSKKENPSDRCEIRIRGRLDPRWMGWFEGFTILELEGEETLLKGAVRDQSELHGLLGKIRDLNLKLVSVRCDEDELDAHERG